MKVRLANGFTIGDRNQAATRATLRIVNDDQEVDFYFRLPNQPWRSPRGIG
jgi:xylan 1,4-beta-xylosidase